jgi:hypothetical protein
VLWTFVACVMDFCRLCYGLLSPVLWTFGLWLWCLTPFSTIFQLYRGGQFY